MTHSKVRTWKSQICVQCKHTWPLSANWLVCENSHCFSHNQAYSTVKHVYSSDKIFLTANSLSLCYRNIGFKERYYSGPKWICLWRGYCICFVIDWKIKYCQNGSKPILSEPKHKQKWTENILFPYISTPEDQIFNFLLLMLFRISCAEI